MKRIDPSVVAGVAALAVYLASARMLVSVDHLTNLLTAYSLALQGDAWLERWSSSFAAFPYWHQTYQGHDLSPTWYAPGAELIGAPLAWLASLAGIVPPQPASALIVGKVAGALCAAGSVSFVHRTAALVAGPRWAAGIAAIYAFGTPTWPTSAAGLWPHAPAQLAIAAGVHLLVAGARRPLLAARSGLALAAAIVVRPQDVVVHVPVWIALARRSRSEALRYAVWSVPPLAVWAIYWLAMFGLAAPPVSQVPPPGDPFVGALGNLISPSRGLFVGSPVLVLGVVGLARAAWERGPLRTVARTLAAGALGILAVHSVYGWWWGGVSYLGRYMADALPILALGLALWVSRSGERPRWRVVLVVLGALSVAIAAIGALVYEWRGALWEESTSIPIEELVWHVDRWQVWYALTTMPRFDGLTVAGVVVLAGALGMLALLPARRRAPS